MRIFVICVGAALVLVLGAIVFYLGPSLCLSRSGRLVDSIGLSDGSRLVLVQRPKSFEYETLLYRRYTNGQVEKCEIGFEESYWWSGGLKRKGEKLIDIRSLGASLCTYDVEKRTTAWNDGSYPKRESSAPVYISVPEDNFYQSDQGKVR